MQFNSGFTTVQILWTLTLAALLVVLVVLLGRDRVRRFPWFTTSIVLVTLGKLASRLLYGRLPQITLASIFITLGDLSMIVALLVLVEIARRAFSGARRSLWIVNALGLLAVGGLVLALWGPWPAWKTLTANSYLAVLGLMQLVQQKGDLLADVLTVEMGLLVVLFGRSFQAGWRSHTQRIMIGLSTVALTHLVAQVIWQLVAMKAVAHSQAEYDRILGLHDKISNANSAVYVAVLVWWIACLWVDEPGTAAPDEPVEEQTTTPEAALPEIPEAVAEEPPAQVVDEPSAEEKPEAEG